MLHTAPLQKRKKSQKNNEETLRILSSTFRGADKAAQHPRAVVNNFIFYIPRCSLEEFSLQNHLLFLMANFHSFSFPPQRNVLTEEDSLLLKVTCAGAGLPETVSLDTL